jgi:hypothetical protein
MPQKASQLKRFKESLATVSRPNKKIRSASGSHPSVDRQVRLNKIEDDFNRFGTKITKQKFQVHGRKLIGTKGNPGLSLEVGEQNVILLLKRASKN